MKVIKKIWLPVVTALIIVIGVLVLTGAISFTQAQQTGETVMKPVDVSEAPLHEDAVLDTAEPSHEAAEPDQTGEPTAAFEKRPIPALPHEYQVTGVGYKPDADQLSFEQVAAIAVDLWKTAFGDAFKPEGPELYVVNTGTGINRSYEVLSGSQFMDGADYACVIDSISGQPLRVVKQTPYKQENLEDDPYSADQDLMTAAMDDPKYKEIIKSFINEKFANGRSILEIAPSCVSWDFYQPDVDMIIGRSVKMSEGECYFVQVAYPSYEVVEVEFYPLGWLSCYYGYFYAEQGKDYPDYEVNGQLPDMSE